MHIDFNKGKFVIQCEYHENRLLNGLTSKQFNQRTKKWLAEPYRKNREYIRRALTSKAECTAAALAEANREEKAMQDTSHLKFPISFEFKTYQPRQHQLEALDFAYGMDVTALVMWMGTGKTKVALDMMSCYFLEGKIDKLLVICPCSVREDTWIPEIEKHVTVDYIADIVYTSTTGKINRIRKLIKEPTDKMKILVVGSESLSVGELKGKAFDLVHDFVSSGKPGVVLDEAHMIKTPPTKSKKALRTVNITHVGNYAKKKMTLTGTPIAHNPMDLFSQYNFLDPEIIGIGNYYAYRNRYAIMGGYEMKQVTGFQNLDELANTLNPFTFQCGKGVLDLPPRTFQTRRLEMTKKQSEIYQRIKKERELALPKGTKNLELLVENILTLYNALQQIASGFVTMTDPETGKREVTDVLRWEDNPKIKEIDDMIPGIDGKVIIWAKFRKEIDILERYLIDRFGDMSFASFHGGVGKDLRKAEVDRWRQADDCRFLISNQQTGGVGNTWNDGRTMLYFSNTFKYIDRVQSMERNHRIGQDKPVLCIDMIMKKTVEEVIMESVQTKQNVADFVLSCIRDGNMESMGDLML